MKAETYQVGVAGGTMTASKYRSNADYGVPSKTGTREWSASSVNCVDGCSNNCWYCYARASAARFGRRPPESWSAELVNLSAASRKYGKRRGRVMFPTTHDITPGNVAICLQILQHLVESGNNVLVVSKPRFDCINLLTDKLHVWRKQVTFRFTIGSVFSEVLRFWEPGAPRLSQRADSLQLAFNRGYATSISMEPMLDDEPETIVNMLGLYVTDTIWLGRANQLRARLTLNHAPADVVAAGHRLMEQQSDEWLRLLYARLKSNPKARFKDSIRRVCGLLDYNEVG